MRACLLIVLLACAVPVAAQEPEVRPVSLILDRWNKIAIAWSITLHELDLGISLYALGTGTVYEQNPLFRRWEDNPIAMTLGKMGVIALTHYALWKLYKWAPKFALVGTLTHASLVGWAVVHNARTIGRLR